MLKYFPTHPLNLVIFEINSYLPNCLHVLTVSLYCRSHLDIELH